LQHIFVAIMSTTRNAASSAETALSADGFAEFFAAKMRQPNSIGISGAMTASFVPMARQFREL
jgi:hypothetical protein